MSIYEKVQAPKWIDEEEVGQLEDVNVRRQIGDTMVDFINGVDIAGYDCLVFLDKSTRPTTWLFIDMYRRMFPNKKRPAVHFVNIGREKRRKVLK